MLVLGVQDPNLMSASERFEEMCTILAEAVKRILAREAASKAADRISLKPEQAIRGQSRKVAQKAAVTQKLPTVPTSALYIMPHITPSNIQYSYTMDANCYSTKNNATNERNDWTVGAFRANVCGAN